MFCVTVCRAGSCLRGRVFRPWLLLGRLALFLLPGLIDSFSLDHKWLTNTEKGHKLAHLKALSIFLKVANRDQQY